MLPISPRVLPSQKMLSAGSFRRSGEGYLSGTLTMTNWFTLVAHRVTHSLTLAEKISPSDFTLEWKNVSDTVLVLMICENFYWAMESQDHSDKERRCFFHQIPYFPSHVHVVKLWPVLLWLYRQFPWPAFINMDKL